MKVAMHLELVARFDYGSITPWSQSTGDGLTLVAGSDALRFHSPVTGSQILSFPEPLLEADVASPPTRKPAPMSRM